MHEFNLISNEFFRFYCILKSKDELQNKFSKHLVLAIDQLPKDLIYHIISFIGHNLICDKCK